MALKRLSKDVRGRSQACAVAVVRRRWQLACVAYLLYNNYKNMVKCNIQCVDTYVSPCPYIYARVCACVPIVASAPDLHIIDPLRRQGQAVRTEALLDANQHHTLKSCARASADAHATGDDAADADAGVYA